MDTRSVHFTKKLHFKIIHWPHCLYQLCLYPSMPSTQGRKQPGQVWEPTNYCLWPCVDSSNHRATDSLALQTGKLELIFRLIYVQLKTDSQWGTWAGKGLDVKHAHGSASPPLYEVCRGFIIAAQLLLCCPAICQLLFHTWQQCSKRRTHTQYRAVGSRGKL